jgi:hypothetical protein
MESKKKVQEVPVYTPSSLIDCTSPASHSDISCKPSNQRPFLEYDLCQQFDIPDIWGLRKDQEIWLSKSQELAQGENAGQRTRFQVLHGSLFLPFHLLSSCILVNLHTVLNQKTALRVNHLGEVIFEILSDARVRFKGP